MRRHRALFLEVARRGVRDPWWFRLSLDPALQEAATLRHGWPIDDCQDN